MIDAYHAIVRIDLYTTAQSGKIHPLPKPTYKCWSVMPDGLHDILLWTEDEPTVWPGDTAILKVYWLFWEDFADDVYVGLEFKLREGRLIAHGEILEVSDLGKELQTRHRS